MFSFTHPAARAIATATLLGIIVLASPLPAASARADDVEARITTLHSALHITAAEEPLWHNVAQVMRENAKVMVTLHKERAQKAQSMSAVDTLTSYVAYVQ